GRVSSRPPVGTGMGGIVVWAAHAGGRFLKAAVRWPNGGGDANFRRQPPTKKSTPPPLLCKRGTYALRYSRSRQRTSRVTWSLIISATLGTAPPRVGTRRDITQSTSEASPVLDSDVCLFPHRVAEGREVAVNKVS